MNRESFLAALTAKPVPFEAGGLSCFLRPLTPGDLLDAQRWAKDRESKSDGYKFFLARSLCDEVGTRLLNDDDIETVGGFLGGFVNAAMDRVFEISGMGDEKKA